MNPFFKTRYMIEVTQKSVSHYKSTIQVIGIKGLSRDCQI